MVPTITVRASFLPIAARCGASLTTPAVRLVSGGAAADLGTAVHAVLARWIRGGHFAPAVEEEALRAGVDPEEAAPLCAWAWRQWEEQVSAWFPGAQTELEMS